MKKGGYVYIISNPRRTVYYTGVTANLYKRTTQHKNGQGSKFTSKYNCTDLIYFEFYNSITTAIKKEKKLKKWKRSYKQKLVKSINPELNDLYSQLDPL